MLINKLQLECSNIDSQVDRLDHGTIEWNEEKTIETTEEVLVFIFQDINPILWDASYTTYIFKYKIKVFLENLFVLFIIVIYNFLSY